MIVYIALFGNITLLISGIQPNQTKFFQMGLFEVKLVSILYRLYL